MPLSCPGLLLAQTAVRAVRVRHAVSNHPVLSPGSGCPAVWCPVPPVSGHLGSSSRGPRSGRLRPPSSVQPSAVHSVRPDASVRLIPHQAVALGDQVEAAGNRHTGMELAAAAAPSGGSVDGREAGRATLPRSRVGQWGVGGGSGPGWVGSGRCAERRRGCAAGQGNRLQREVAAPAAAAVLGWVCDHSAWSSPSLTAGWAARRGHWRCRRGCARGPSAAQAERTLPARCRQCSDLRRWVVGPPGLEPGTSSYQRWTAKRCAIRPFRRSRRSMTGTGMGWIVPILTRLAVAVYWRTLARCAVN